MRELFLITFFFHFSQVRFGLGIAFNSFGILWLLIKFHRNVHMIRDPKKSNPPWISTSLLKLFIIFSTAFSINLLIPQTFTYRYTHVQPLLFLLCIQIVLPKYFINQNDNLKLYASVYHLQPPPILPWQLPEHFDPNSVRLVFIKCKSE